MVVNDSVFFPIPHGYRSCISLNPVKFLYIPVKYVFPLFVLWGNQDVRSRLGLRPLHCDSGTFDMFGFGSRDAGLRVSVRFRVPGWERNMKKQGGRTWNIKRKPGLRYHALCCLTDRAVQPPVEEHHNQSLLESARKLGSMLADVKPHKPPKPKPRPIHCQQNRGLNQQLLLRTNLRAQSRSLNAPLLRPCWLITSATTIDPRNKACSLQSHSVFAGLDSDGVRPHFRTCQHECLGSKTHSFNLDM